MTPQKSARFSSAGRKRAAPRRAAAGEPTLIYGLHAAEAALANPNRPIERVLATANAAQRLSSAIAERGLTPVLVSPKEIDARLGPSAVHQGVLVEAGPLPGLDVADIAEARLVVALDQITDPHNVGAILRSCSAFGVGGVVMTAHHCPPLSGALAKAASGGLDAAPIVLAANLAQALAELGEMGFWRVGLDSGAESALEAEGFDGPTVIVLGAEDKGLRRLTRERCDRICAITTADALRSLNVSNAAAIALHLAAQKQKSRA
ncbi:MAG: 23S rRNA (guanosine(2251)-2'-O)-methyltransferase RlmB [Hyphomicrobiales bacterium]|nr:23S rRNA (guanosine(2251)-2'-O)-methyltransferase RlmB [Hyphomicrobiales bacterium]